MNSFITSITRTWFAFGRLLNTIVTTILLTLVFCILIVPAGLIRRITGADPLQLKQFKRSRNSVLAARNHLYTADDLKNLF